MVYRSSRRPPANEEDANLQENMSFDSTDSDEKEDKFLNQAGTWKKISIFLILLCIGLFIGIIVIGSGNNEDSAIPLCGKGSNSVSRVIDLSEPDQPGPFHDLTKKEIRSILSFLQTESSIKLKDLQDATIGKDAMVHTMELYPPKKAEVQAYLSGKRSQPKRLARVILFRSDLKPPVVQELVCGPLPHVTKCPLIKSNSRRNPVEYSLRPIGFPADMAAVFDVFYPKVDKQIGYILRESYGASYANCKPRECLKFYPATVGTNIVKDINTRKMWMSALYNTEYYGMYVLDFGMLIDFSSVNPEDHHITEIWYHGQFFESLEDFIRQYNQSSIQKSRMRPPTVEPKDSFSSLFQRGDPMPETPQRPPTLVEPDGKRYSVKHREVDYLGWKFNFRMSPLSGPIVNNIRYRGDRIAYEISLSDIAVLYSSNNPIQRQTDYVDSGTMMGMASRALIPGADCPDTATFISQTLPSQEESEPMHVKHGFCLFENNNGFPTRRHSSYSQYEGAFYGGMQDSALVLRSIQTVVNYDYIIDFIFYQTGAVQSRVMSTGYILPAFYNLKEEQYGWHTHKNFLAPIHHHMFHFRVDLDISGTSNRYETLDIKPDKVLLRSPRNHEYHQTKFDRNLHKTEKEALFKFDFEKPKYHIVHNDAKKSDLGTVRAYRIHMTGMSKQLLAENKNNEPTFSWGRHQLVVTKQKDDEFTSSSPYAFFDSLNPVVNFSRFYEDDENIVDEDLVFWITSGVHHIPHTEDIPITPTIGANVDFYLLPYNYFTYCPSFHSRDHIRIQLKDSSNPDEGVSIDRHGYKDEQCRTPKYATAYDELLRKEPDVAVEA